jgi:hypothetical protein
MARRWSFEEDYIICKFAYEYMYACFPHQEIERLMLELKEYGVVDRSEKSVENRVRAYLSVFTGENRDDVGEQIESMAHAYLSKMVNSYRTEISQPYLPFDYNADIIEHSNFFDSNNNHLNKYVSLRLVAPSFKELLLDYIQRSGRTASDIYNAAYVTRDKFNHIINGRKGKNIKPNDNENKVNATHRTVMKLCLGLRLGYADAVYFMACAGYAFRPNEPVDMVVVECIKHEIWNMVKVNIELYEHKLELFSKKDKKTTQAKKQKVKKTSD